MIEDLIEKYRKGEDDLSDAINFTNSEPDLWLGIRAAMVTITDIQEITITKMRFGKKYTYTQYIVSVKLTDTYDFNIGNESGDGIGSILNNIGYFLQENHIGKKYDLEVSYEYTSEFFKIIP